MIDIIEMQQVDGLRVQRPRRKTAGVYHATSTPQWRDSENESHTKIPSQKWPHEFLRTGDMKGFFHAVKWIHGQTVEPPRASQFSFELNMEAAMKNALVLRKYDYDLKKAIEAQPGTTISYGSEIRPLVQLDVLLHNRQQSRRRTVKNAMRNLQKHFSNQPFWMANHQQPFSSQQLIFVSVCHSQHSIHSAVK